MLLFRSRHLQLPDPVRDLEKTAPVLPVECRDDPLHDHGGILKVGRGQHHNILRPAVPGDHISPPQAVGENGKQLIHRIVQGPQLRHPAAGQRDRQKRQMDAGPVAGGPAGLQPVGLPEEAVLAHKGPGRMAVSFRLC